MLGGRIPEGPQNLKERRGGSLLRTRVGSDEFAQRGFPKGDQRPGDPLAHPGMRVLNGLHQRCDSPEHLQPGRRRVAHPRVVVGHGQRQGLHCRLGPDSSNHGG